MLAELYIENLAVIEKASIRFTKDLNVFTGETGAGKSILINGINAILGQRITKDIVRTGADKAVITAAFTDVSDECVQMLEQGGFGIDDGQLFLEREVRSDGGSVARINNRPVNISLLRQIGEMLVNIHGQHDNQILLSADKHIKILDSYAEAQEMLEDYQQSFHKLQKLAKQINQLKMNDKQKQFRISELYDICNEIENLDLKQDEDKLIENELALSKNAVALSEAIYASNTIIAGNDDTSGVIENISLANDSIEEYSDIMPEISALSERLSSAKIELQDISQELDSILDKLNVDPKRYDWLNQRSDDIRRICKKYGPELADVFRTLEDSRKELDSLENSEQDIQRLENEKKELLTDVSRKAMELSKFRKDAAERFVEQVTGELEFLNMPNVRIVVDNKPGKLTVNGLDNIEFLISANIGEEPRPLAKIASGGELSRIMLALKNVIAEKDSINTLVFDEIDTGVSGRAAQKIGMKLKQIAKFRQVLCVTHLAQIAVMADNHMLIEKSIIGERTVTTVKTLDEDQRRYEVARIMGGDNITPLLLENAGQLIDDARKGVFMNN